jgi:hypothetical protein
MDSIKLRMVAVAVLVCGFAVGMAGLLNYFKFRTTATSILKDRLLVTGRAIDNTIQSSLVLGLQFKDIGTLPATLQRERSTDDLIQSIDIFDPENGRVIYSTDAQRIDRPVPAHWIEAANKAGTSNDGWFSEHGDESAAGMAIDNSFGLIMGHLVLRYSSEKVDETIHAVGRDLALGALLIFLVSAGLSSLALLRVMAKLDRDVRSAEQALRAGGVAGTLGTSASGPFGKALHRFVETVRLAESQIAEQRAQLHRGGKP